MARVKYSAARPSLPLAKDARPSFTSRAASSFGSASGISTFTGTGATNGATGIGGTGATRVTAGIVPPFCGAITSQSPAPAPFGNSSALLAGGGTPANALPSGLTPLPPPRMIGGGATITGGGPKPYPKPPCLKPPYPKPYPNPPYPNPPYPNPG